MSALGQKQTSKQLRSMSALTPKADIGTGSWNVCFVPKADIGEVYGTGLHYGPRVTRRTWACLVRVLSRAIGSLKLLHVVRRELRLIDCDGQLVDLAGKPKWDLIVVVIDRSTSVRSNVECLVPLQHKRHSTIHRLGRNNLAVDFQRASAGAADSGQVVEGKRGVAQTVVLEVEHDAVLARRENVRAFPTDPFEVKQVPNKDRFAFQQVHSVAAKTPAVCLNHALRATSGYVDVGCDGVGGVEQVWRVPMRNSGYRLARIGEHATASRQVGTWRHQTRCCGRIQGEHLVFGELAEHQI